MMDLHPDECVIRPNGPVWRCIRSEHGGRECRTRRFDFARDGGVWLNDPLGELPPVLIRDEARVPAPRPPWWRRLTGGHRERDRGSAP